MKDNVKRGMSALEIKRLIDEKLNARGVGSVKEVSAEQVYQALVLVLKDILKERREEFKSCTRRAKNKKICYMCMEFLIGRSLKTVAQGLKIYDEVISSIKEFGYDFEEVFALEADPGLGNGGLGRLAACFMDSLSALGYLANGYSLLYENKYAT